MKLLSVALVLFFRKSENHILEVWTQTREDDGPYHGLLEFPGGKIEPGETPLEAAVREVQEEVGISINPEAGEFMGIYTNPLTERVILLNVFLFPDQPTLLGKGQWLRIEKGELSAPYKEMIPGPNHQVIDDLYRSLYSELYE